MKPTPEEPYHPQSPAWARRGTCLACGKRVVFARDSFLQIGGKRDGSVLIFFETDPLRSQATDIDAVFEGELELLGVTHRACRDIARVRLERQEVVFPKELPTLMVDEESGQLPHLHLPPESKQCPFCGGSPLTEEHAWSQWISDQLRTKSDSLVDLHPIPTAKSIIPAAASTCAPCNNRWISVIDNDVKPVLEPLIDGRDSNLTSDEQRLLATWAVKTAFMLDLSSDSPVIPLGYYYDFRLQRSPLPSHIVWIGAYKDNKWAAWARLFPLHLRIPATDPPNGFLATFTAFRAVFQVLGHFTKGGASLRDGRPEAKALSTIWPSEGKTVPWPKGGLAFGNQSLDQLAGPDRILGG